MPIGEDNHFLGGIIMCEPVDDEPCTCKGNYRITCSCGICQICHRRITRRINSKKTRKGRKNKK